MGSMGCSAFACLEGIIRVAAALSRTCWAAGTLRAYRLASLMWLQGFRGHVRSWLHLKCLHLASVRHRPLVSLICLYSASLCDAWHVRARWAAGAPSI